MERIKTNIIELDKLFNKPCPVWLKRFKNGKLNAHEAFIKYGEQYMWLYENSPYDLISWEIENNCFNWKENDYYVPQYCPDKMDFYKFDWKQHGWLVYEFCPEILKLKPKSLTP